MTTLLTIKVLYIMYTNKVTFIVELGIVTLLISTINKTMAETEDVLGIAVRQYDNTTYEVISLLLIMFGLILTDIKKRKST